jgi:uncharacterized protein YggE
VNRKILLGVLVGVSVIAVLLVGFALGRLGDDSPEAASRTVTVTGIGKVEAAPDVAEVSLGVSATGKKARAARTAADARMTRVLATLKAQGVEPADIRTAEISLSPNFGRNGSTVVGYTATNTVTATIRKLDSAGAVVAAAAGAGANAISGPSLTVSDETAVYARAVPAAVAPARTHAEAIAEASGDSIGGLRSATEGSENSPVAYEVSAKAADGTPTPIEPGTIEVTASVTATFELD